MGSYPLAGARIRLSTSTWVQCGRPKGSGALCFVHAKPIRSICLMPIKLGSRRPEDLGRCPIVAAHAAEMPWTGLTETMSGG